MSEEWRKWKHITKIDPDKKITPEIIKTIIETETDAIMISGTQNINKRNVTKIIEMLKPYDIPKVLEPANVEGVVEKGVDWIFVPTVFNTNNATYINGLHKMWAKYNKNINWDIVVPEAYIILNPNCAAAKYTDAKPLPKEDIIAAAITAEKFFKIPIIYIEYSGMYGDPEIVKAVKEALTSSHLIYGGGINTKEKAEEMSKYATIVVGNTIYEGGIATFINTMRGTLLKELAIINRKLSKLKEMSEKNGKKERLRDKLKFKIKR
ncbi:MAG: heptaprenylglyceryl phosphate synthase [Candidatus Aenigmarchaeota archaeon]|nr:heptaprenylglyceryl phosphate synthase [Candidatus Aenigmarchaeota archaeon]